MNTKQAYEKFKKGLKVRVVVTNAVDGVQSFHEIDEAAWQRRLKDIPNNTNYVLF